MNPAWVPVLGTLALGLSLECPGRGRLSAAEGRPVPGGRIFPLPAPSGARSGFAELPPGRTGITFTNRLDTHRGLTNQIFLNGSGVAAGDVNGDGHCDLYFCGLDSPNALYLNRGDWRFELAPAASAVACADQASTGAVLADLDGDGDLDLVVNAVHRGPRVFLNDSSGRFEEVTPRAGLGSAAGGASLALADVDGDGDLDLYVVNYRRTTMRDEPEKRFRVATTNGVYRLLAVDDRPVSPEMSARFTVDPVAGVLENGEADALYLNLGDGRFQRVDWAAGFRTEEGQPSPPLFDWGLSALFHDLNGDGAPDLYVCNDFQSPDRIWLNDGRGIFQALPRSALGHTSLFSMGVDVADVDRDGWDDLFIADMLSRRHALRQVQVLDLAPVVAADSGAAERPQISRNTLLRNRGDGTYAEVAHYAGVEASEWSWCPLFLDVDLDGFADLLITTGHGRDLQNADVAAALDEARRRQRLSFADQLRQRVQFEPLRVPNVAFRNRGDFTFEDLGESWGFDSPRISHGMALADLDQDGDLDVVINCLNDAPLVYRNEAPRARIAVRLRGNPPNTQGIGARVCVSVPGVPRQCQEFISGGRYLSSDEAVRTFAAGESGEPLTVEVRWRNGQRSVIADLPANVLVEVDEASARPHPQVPASADEPWFSDQSAQLKHVHQDEPFDDFARQKLLPRKLSEPGPGLAWFDFNGDGWDDLIVGTGRGGRPAVFRNDMRGGFVPQRAGTLLGPSDRDLTAVLGWRPDPAQVVLLFGQSNYEDGQTNAAAVRQIHLTSGQVDESLRVERTGAGALALGDVDGDGAPDLFVGGHALAGGYPNAGPARIYRTRQGRLEMDAAATRAVSGCGLVHGAIFSDLDGDGRAELIVVGEWQGIRIYRNQSDGLHEWDLPVGSAGAETPGLRPLSQWTGGWNSVVAGDFDNDGRMDLVAGNWGRNTRNQRFVKHPLELHFTDADGDGVLDLIEGHFDGEERKVVPARDWKALCAAFPMLQERYAGFTAFSRAGIADLASAGMPDLARVTQVTLESALFLNRGDHLEWRPLPFEAQVSPVFGLAVADFDGDGNEDLFAAQNFFGLLPGEGRMDAGQGVWLRGDGRGGFAAVPVSQSGLLIPGEGRGTAVSDYDRDGRPDLVVGQNRGPTRLFRNVRAQPGLRIHLKGTAKNPAGLGAQVRLVYRDGTKGPVREIRAGGGYASQDSSVPVLGRGQAVDALEVRWPDGRSKRYPVPEDARGIVVE